MKKKIGFGLAIACLLAVVVAGLALPDERSDPKNKYAEIRLTSTNRFQVLICANKWQGLFTAHGFGGYKYCILYWSTLDGSGPIYKNPVFHKNDIEQFDHIGTIEISRDRKQLVINLERITSKLGGPQKTEPSPANGTYKIKDINYDPIEIPE